MEAEVSEQPDPIDRLIARLYRTVVSVGPRDYRAWALDALKKVIPHDMAIWGSGNWEQRRFHALTTTGVGPEIQPALESTADENPLIRTLMASPPGRPTTMESVMPDAEFYRSRLYLRTFAPYGIERLLSTVHLDRRSGLYSLVSLYRSDRSKPFTREEQAAQRRLMYHLFNGISHSFFIHLARTLRDRPPGSSAAAVDAMGRYHEAQPRFLDAIDRHFPNAKEHLPIPIPPPGETFTTHDLCFRAEPIGDLSIIHCWEAGPLDRLTSREREIVEAVVHGLSFKQAARKIGVAPSTVANHLYRIYRKLGVNSRTALADLFHVKVHE